MRNAVRCCISCILPCGFLDVIRIVHHDGHVEEIGASAVTAADIMKHHPKHVLRKPSADPSKISVNVLPPDALLKRGQIYFLIPLPPETIHRRSSAKIRKKMKDSKRNAIADGGETAGAGASAVNFVISDRYMSQALSDGRRGRAAVWRPCLESISETPAPVEPSSINN